MGSCSSLSIVAETSARCCTLNAAVTASGGKRLEQGQFHSHAGQAVKQLLALTELKLIIDGIDTRSIRYHKRYVKPDTSNSKTSE